MHYMKLVCWGKQLDCLSLLCAVVGVCGIHITEINTPGPADLQNHEFNKPFWCEEMSLSGKCFHCKHEDLS